MFTLSLGEFQRKSSNFACQVSKIQFVQHSAMEPVKSDDHQKPKPSSKPPALPMASARYSIMNKQQMYPLRRGLPDSQSGPKLAKPSRNLFSSTKHGLSNNLPSMPPLPDETKLCKSMMPLKPKVTANEVFEIEYAKYLEEVLICSMLEEDEETINNIVADEELVGELEAHFDTREIKIALVKNHILHSKMSDIAVFGCLLSSIAPIVGLLTPDLNQSLLRFTSSLSKSVDRLPITDCVFHSGNPDLWRNMARVARQLQAALESEEKPFCSIKLLENQSEEVKNKIAKLELSINRRKFLNQTLTFLASLRLSHRLQLQHQQEMQEEGYEDEPSFVIDAPHEEEQKLDTDMGNDGTVTPDDFSDCDFFNW